MADFDSEEWAPIASVNGKYEVSNQGRVRHAAKKSIRKPDVDKDGYHAHTLYIGDYAKRRVTVHRAVLTAFVGDCPIGCEARHLNGVRSDNRLCNLAWATHKENCSDKVRHGTQQHGVRHPMAKLTEADVRRIRNVDWRERSKLAKELGINYSTICSVVNRETWRSVP